MLFAKSFKLFSKCNIAAVKGQFTEQLLINLIAPEVFICKAIWGKMASKSDCKASAQMFEVQQHQLTEQIFQTHHISVHMRENYI